MTKITNIFLQGLQACVLVYAFDMTHKIFIRTKSFERTLNSKMKHILYVQYPFLHKSYEFQDKQTIGKTQKGFVINANMSKLYFHKPKMFFTHTKTL